MDQARTARWWLGRRSICRGILSLIRLFGISGRCRRRVWRRTRRRMCGSGGICRRGWICRWWGRICCSRIMRNSGSIRDRMWGSGAAFTRSWFGLRSSGASEDAAGTAGLRGRGGSCRAVSKWHNASTFGVNPGSNCVDVPGARAQASCCGVNLAHLWAWGRFVFVHVRQPGYDFALVCPAGVDF
jgi:hypothetical protein